MGWSAEALLNMMYSNSLSGKTMFDQAMEDNAKWQAQLNTALTFMCYNAIFNSPKHIVINDSTFNPNSRLDMIESNLAKYGVNFIPNHGSLTAFKINHPNDFFTHPSLFGTTSPNTLYQYLKENGYNPSPLADGHWKNISFEQGGGYKINWGGDRILMYHPEEYSHHGGSYWKISSGPTGTLRFNKYGELIS